MKKVIGVLIISTLCWLNAFAQTNAKMNFHTAKVVTDPTMQSETVRLLVVGDIEKIAAYTYQKGGDFQRAAGNVAKISLMVAEIQGLSEQTFVKKLEIPSNIYSRSVLLNDSMRATAHVNEVHAGLAPLTQAYDGSGVVVGIIDSGVDFSHPDLKTAGGNTRILHIWDQNKPVAANTPPAYGYGQEWDNTAIDGGQAGSHNDQAYFGHGTHVTGIAAGNGMANGSNKGVAPGADFIVVAFDFNNTTDPTYLDAVEYIFDKAQAAGKPCVINASLGDYIGSHDGADVQSLYISNLINAQSGRSVVAAAGNAGTIPFHLGYDVTSDTTFTWMVFNTAYPFTYFQVWGDTALFKNTQFTIGGDQNTTSPSFSGNLPFRNINFHLGQLKQENIIGSSGNRIAVVQSFGSIQGGTYLLEMAIAPDSNSYVWRWTTTGSGHFDIWKFKDGTGSSGFVYNNLPSAGTVPDIVNYMFPDSNQTMVTGMQCLDNVITVGNFGNRNSYVDVNGNTYNDPSTIPGQLAQSSSWGPTRDGRIKPEITAPGGIMLSSGELSLLQTWSAQPGNAPKVAQGGFHFRDGGTSSSSPVVAGTVALYMQQNPTANAATIKNAIINCALQDNFTGNLLPDNKWGYGKVSAFNTLSNCNTLSVPGAGFVNSAIVFPNPATAEGKVSVRFSSEPAKLRGTVKITELTGRTIIQQNVNHQSEIQFSLEAIAKGVYLVIYESEGRIKVLSKLTIAE